MIRKIRSIIKTIYVIMEGFYYNSEIEYMTEIIKNKLYFAVLESDGNKLLKSTMDTYYFTIDEELVYLNYYFDFGPLNISCLYKYCCKLNAYLQGSQGFRRIVHYTTSDPNRRVNSAYLMGSFAIIYLNMQPKDIYKILLNTGGPFRNFVDASQGISQYTIKLTDCLQAIEKAATFRFFDFGDFNVEEYDTHDRLQNGDMNWLVPRKFLAFIGPTDNEYLNAHQPEFYIKYFQRNDIKVVIRLNNKLYDSVKFTQAGIEHHDLFFPDGTTPPKAILLKFFEISENTPAAIAVHCKAGLGRTGSLIGAYIIKHYHLTAREAIAWMRICRPGSVIGQQQDWLEKVENWLWRQGSQYRLQHFGEGDKIPQHKYGIYSIEWPMEKKRYTKQLQYKKEDLANKGKTHYRAESFSKQDPVPYNRATRSANVTKKVVKCHDYERKTLINDDNPELRKVAKLLSRVQKAHPDLAHKITADETEVYRLQDHNPDNLGLDGTPRAKLGNRKCSKYSCPQNQIIEAETQISRLQDLKNRRRNAENYNRELCYKTAIPDILHEDKIQNYRSKSHSYADTMGPANDKSMSDKIKRRLRNTINLIETQGDKLNKIKAIRQLRSEAVDEPLLCKNRDSKISNRLVKMSDIGPYSASCSKKHGGEYLQPIKRPYIENVYPRA